MPATEHKIHEGEVVLTILGGGNKVSQANLLQRQRLVRKIHR